MDHDQQGACTYGGIMDFNAAIFNKPVFCLFFKVPNPSLPKGKIIPPDKGCQEKTLKIQGYHLYSSIGREDRENDSGLGQGFCDIRITRGHDNE